MLEVKISERAEQILRDLAAQNNQDVSEFAGKILEKEVAGNAASNGGIQQTENKSEDDYQNPFEPFIGMLSSGKTDISVRYKEILLEEIDKRGGFGGS